MGQPEKARELWEQVARKYQENLRWYSTFDIERQYSLGSEIITDIERYRSLVDLLIMNDEDELAREKAEEFNQYLMLFEHFYGSSQAPEEVEQEIRQEQIPEEVIDTMN